MITYLNGILEDKQPTRIVLDVAGVGYEVLIPLSSFDRLPSTQTPCKILIYDCVREDSHQLFGFMTEAERALFLLLITVKNIGPKMAMTVLSGIPVRELITAISTGDTARLKSISGVGKAKADQIIVELKNKISAVDQFSAMSELATPETQITRDALLALIALGYRQDEARKMITTVVPDATKSKLTVEEVVRKALGR